MRHCPLAARHDRDLLAVGGRPRERRVDRACQRIRAPRDDRPIATIDRMRGELFCQADVRAVVLCGDARPRRILVYPVDDPRPPGSAYLAYFPRDMLEQRVDQRAAEITRG